MSETPGAPGRGAGETLVRLRLDLAYDGTGFSGWALQPGLRTVEGVLTEAVGRVLRSDPAPRLVVAGRTDAGVHARAQVAHLDVDGAALARVPGRSSRSPEEALVTRLAGVLPADVRVHGVGRAPEGFDARFAATRRRYAYRVGDDPSGVPPLRRFDVLHHRRALDATAMDEAVQALVGLHEFAAFCKPREGATTVRTLLRYSWRRVAEGPDAGLLVADVQADAFCHSMVRALVGCALAVGDGRRGRDWPAQVLAAAVRDPAVTIVPPHGLTLEEVAYPPPHLLAARVLQARAVRELPACAQTGDDAGGSRP